MAPAMFRLVMCLAVCVGCGSSSPPPAARPTQPELAASPEQERAELAGIYRSRGLS